MSQKGQTRSFALVEPPASFTLTSRPRRDNQVVALGPMLSASDRFRFLEKKSQMGEPRLLTADQRRSGSLGDKE